MSKRAPDDTSWHREQISKACRGVFAAEGTVEEAQFGWAMDDDRPAELSAGGLQHHVRGYRSIMRPLLFLPSPFATLVCPTLLFP
jgi:hypothetical protein